MIAAAHRRDALGRFWPSAPPGQDSGTLARLRLDSCLLASPGRNSGVLADPRLGAGLLAWVGNGLLRPRLHSGCVNTRGGTRARNLLLRREAPYPLGHTNGCMRAGCICSTAKDRAGKLIVVPARAQSRVAKNRVAPGRSAASALQAPRRRSFAKAALVNAVAPTGARRRSAQRWPISAISIVTSAWRSCSRERFLREDPAPRRL